MKKIFLPIITAALLIGAASCEETKKEDSKRKDIKTGTIEAAKIEAAVFSYNSDSTTVNWEAFKTTERKGVKGHFTEFEVTGTSEGSTPVEVFSEATFVIQTNSVNTGMELRDNRIINNFFKVFVNTATITGKVKSLSDTTGVLEISLNEMTNDIPVLVISNGNKFALEGEIDLGLFNGQPAVDSLNEVCIDVHKGADGITKLWPDVKIKVSTVLTAK
jgi:polyisoprenoid-binding protein YceI